MLIPPLSPVNPQLALICASDRRERDGKRQSRNEGSFHDHRQKCTPPADNCREQAISQAIVTAEGYLRYGDISTTIRDLAGVQARFRITDDPDTEVQQMETVEVVEEDTGVCHCSLSRSEHTGQPERAARVGWQCPATVRQPHFPPLALASASSTRWRGCCAAPAAAFQCRPASTAAGQSSASAC